MVQIGQNARKIPIYKVTFDDADNQSVSQDAVYMVFVPPGVNNMPFDAMVRAANGGQEKEYFGYIYTPDAQTEKDRRADPAFSARFPGTFFVSEKGLRNTRLVDDIRTFEQTNSVQFKTSGSTQAGSNGILLANRIYALVMNEPTPTIISSNPPAVCGNEWKDNTEQCDDGNIQNGDGCSSTCVLEKSLTCGNGVTDADEQCDDGAQNGQNDSDCRIDCRLKVPVPFDNPNGNPGIEVLENTTPIPAGGELAFGLVALNTKATRIITVKNTGTAPLKIGPTVLANPPFAVGTFGKTTLEPGDTTTMPVSIQSNAEASVASVISFPTNIAGGSPFAFTARATVRPEQPGIGVQLNNVPVLQGQTVDLGNSDIANPKEIPLDIVNTGLSNLSVSGINMPGGLTLAGTPVFPLTISPQQKTTLTVKVTGTGNPTLTGTIGILTNVPYIPIYSFDIKAKILLPQIKILQYGQELSDVTGLADFGTTLIDKPVTKTLDVLNIGSSVLTLAFPQTTIGDFEVDTTNTSLVLQPGAGTSFKIVLKATQAASLVSQMMFATNVPSKNPFIFTMKGTVRVPVTKMEVYENERLLANGDSINLGYNDPDHPASRTLTVKNAGETVLLLSSPVADMPPVSVSGNIRLSANVTTIQLQPGQTTTFTVEQKFSQTAVAGKVTIVSTDPLNKQFVINTTGSMTYSLQGHVYASVIVGTIMYLGGDFSAVNNTPRTNLAAIDLTTGKLTSWADGFSTDSPVLAMAAGNGTVFIGGEFRTVNDRPHAFVAGITTDGNLKSNKAPIRDATIGQSGVYALAVDTVNNRLYVGGRFGRNDFGTQTNVYQDLALIGMNMTYWFRDTNFVPQMDRGQDRSNELVVYSIAVDYPTIYVGGRFYANELNHGTTYDLAAIDTNGHILPWTPAASDDGSQFRSIAVSGNTVYVGGTFAVSGSPLRNLASLPKYNAPGSGTGQNGETYWNAAWTPNPDGQITSLLSDGTTLYVAGDFIHISGIETGKFAAYRQNTLQRLTIGNPFAPSAVDTLVSYDATSLLLFGNSAIARISKP